MRASVLVWSAVSGAILGFFIDATLIGVALIVGAVVPAIRLQHRWATTAAACVLIAIFLAMTVLGCLEGWLKAA